MRMFFDDAKARRALGYQTRPAALAVAAAVRWFSDRDAERREQRSGFGDRQA